MFFKNSLWSCSLKKGVLKKFPIFTRKHLCWSLFSIKLPIKKVYQFQLLLLSFKPIPTEALVKTFSLKPIQSRAFAKIFKLKPIRSRAFVKICTIKPIQSMEFIKTFSLKPMRIEHFSKPPVWNLQEVGHLLSKLQHHTYTKQSICQNLEYQTCTRQPSRHSILWQHRFFVGFTSRYRPIAY